MKRILMMVILMLLAATAFALPSVEAVQAEVARGNYTQAEGMMRDVIAARPGSARAHYLYSEILAHDRHFDQAAQQAQLAQSIAPDLGFTQPERFRAFERLLQREQHAGSRSPAASSRVMGGPAGMPASGGSGAPAWAWALGAAALAALLWRAVGARSGLRAAPLPPAPASAGPAPTAYGTPPPGTGYVPTAAGSGMLGTGLAAAGGLATGMLVEKLLDERGSALGSIGTAPAPEWGGASSPDANPAAADLEQRPIDFGSGDEWNDGGGLGDSDSGSGSDDNNGGW